MTDNQDNCCWLFDLEFLSLCWYWWVLLLVAAGVGYGTYRMINSEEKDK